MVHARKKWTDVRTVWAGHFVWLRSQERLPQAGEVVSRSRLPGSGLKRGTKTRGSWWLQSRRRQGAMCERGWAAAGWCHLSQGLRWHLLHLNGSSGSLVAILISLSTLGKIWSSFWGRWGVSVIGGEPGNKFPAGNAELRQSPPREEAFKPDLKETRENAFWVPPDLRRNIQAYCS